ncbi:MAG: hypothetical protein KKD44_28455 [Proteobacteria bacterium]|nr:hypothetical protein [Pseudomonadota bacterium]
MSIIDEYLESMEFNPMRWGMFVCTEHFRKEPARFQFKILDEAQKNPNLAIAAPRESSKTTLLGFLYPLHSIVYKKKRFIVIITSVYTKSCGCLDAMKKEVRDNPQFREDFPLKITRDAEGDTIFRQADGFETRVLCKGRDQIGSIRGEKFGAYRPDLIIVDDVEDDEMVKNPERRQEIQDLFDQVIMYAGETGKTQIIVIGTILHDDSLLSKLVSSDQYKEFRKLLYRGRYESNGVTRSLWDAWRTVEQLNAQEKRNPSSFAKEVQNDPVSGMMSKFNKEDFRYWHIDNMQYVLFGKEGEVVSRDNLNKCKAAIACDLAWEEKRENDFSVILPAFLTPNSEILVETYFCRKGMRPHEMEEILFTMENRLRSLTGSSVFIGFEKAKLEKVMKWLLKEAMRRRNHYLLFKDLQWDLDKIQRIVTRLQPRYNQHVIYHRRGMGELEHQLLRVPSGVHDDLADALQGVVQLLEYPKHQTKAKVEDDEFTWWRKLAIDSRHPKKKRYVFGHRGTKRFEVPAQVSYR